MLVATVLVVTVAPTGAAQTTSDGQPTAITDLCGGSRLGAGASIRCGHQESAPAADPAYVSVNTLATQAVLATPPTLSLAASLRTPMCAWAEAVNPTTGATQPSYLCPTTGPAGQNPARLAAARRAALRLLARGGSIGATPAGHTLVNLDTYFWVHGVGPRDTGLVTRDGFRMRIRAIPEGVWWDFGDGTRDGYGLGRPGQASDVVHAYRDMGVYTVRVWVGWRVVFTADGVTRQLPGAFQTSLSRRVPVDELRTILTH
jgi:hypothetical protein